MKRLISITVVVVLFGLVLVFLHEKHYYSKAGQTRVVVRFLEFTNSGVSTLRLATFAISNASPWAVFNFEYAIEEVRQATGKVLSLTHSFEGGSWVLQPQEVMIDHVQISTIEQTSWRLIADFGRYEDPIIHTLHQVRFHFTNYITSPPWDFYRTNTEWISE